jgi:cell division septum initiation protein DivIVA
VPLPWKSNDSSDSSDWPSATEEESLSGGLSSSAQGDEDAPAEPLLGQPVASQPELEHENAKLREQIAELEAELARHRAQEQLLGTTLLSATSHAMTIREEARRDAELTLRKARAAAERRTALAEQVDRDRAAAERELERLRRLAQEMQAGLADFLTNTLEQLQTEPEDGAAEPEPEPLGPLHDTLAGALEEALKQEGDELSSESGGVAPLSSDQ